MATISLRSGADSPADSVQPVTVQSRDVMRHALLARMTAAGNARLIFIHGPAGFGKSVLLAQYRTLCVEQGRQVLLLRLDAGDNDLARFIARLAAGLQVGAPSTGHGPSSGAHSARELLAELAYRSTPYSILLDGFAAIVSPLVLDFVQQLLVALPSAGCLVIASRTDADIGLGRLRASGQLHEISSRALALSLAETYVFLREKHGLTMGGNEVAELQQCTQGWPGALALLATAVAQGQTASARVAALGAPDGGCLDRLFEDVLSDMKLDCRRFMLQTSVLAQLSAPLCDAVTGRDDSQATIEALRRADLLISVVGEPGVFRYHRLLGVLLRGALQRKCPGRAGGLRLKAAHWLLAAGQPLAAIDQLVRAGHWQEAARQLSGRCDALLESGRSRWLLCQLEQVPEPWLAGYTGLRLAHAWALILSGRHAQALALAQGLEDGAHRDLVRCLVLVSRDQIQACRDLGLTLLQRLAPNPGFAYGAMLHTLAYSSFALGLHDDARSLLSEAVGHAAQQGSDAPGRTAVMIETLMDLTQGRLAMARARVRCSEQQGGSLLLLDIARALVLYETDALDEAAQLLHRHLPRVGDGSPTDALIVSHLLAARIACVQGKTSAGRQHLAALEQIGHERACARILCAVWVERVRMATLGGNLQAAGAALHQVEQRSAWEHPQVFFYGNDVDTPTVARVRLDVARGRFADALRALHPAIAEAQERGLLRRVLKLRLLYALALEGSGQQTQAFEALTQALRFASHEGWRSSFLEEGASMAGLLRRWALSFQAQVGTLGIASGFTCDLWARFNRWGVALFEPGSHGAQQTLTEREQQILALLTQGRQVREIAQCLGLSEHTVKTHLRNLYRKLGANGRAQATAIARALGLLGPDLDQDTRGLGAHNGLGTPGYAQLGVDVLDVRLDRVGRDIQAFADFPVGEPFGQKFQHTDLTA